MNELSLILVRLCQKKKNRTEEDTFKQLIKNIHQMIEDVQTSVVGVYTTLVDY